MATQSSLTRSYSHTGLPISAARLFSQVAPRRYLHKPTLSVLDFLVPSISTSTTQYGKASRFMPLDVRSSVRRNFASSSRRQQTTAIVNPKKDDDGDEMSVEITPRASNRLKEIMSKDSNPNLALRIQVESGGCHGFQYLMSLTTLPALVSSPGFIQVESSPAINTSLNDPNSMASNSSSTSPVADEASQSGKLDEDDTVFAADDGSGAKVVMDGPSLELLKGSKIDFTMELIGSQFKIVDNPLATSSCGCGTSFDIKA